MAFIPCPNVAMVELRYDYLNQRAENTLYFAGVTAPGFTLDVLATNIASWWTTNIKPLQSNVLSLVEIAVTDLSTATSPALSHTVGLPDAGAKATAAEPNNVSLAVTFATNARGRSSRGRNYVLGLCTDQVSNSGVSPTLIAQYVAAYTLLAASGFVPGGTWSVLSRFTNKAPRSAGVHAPVTAVRVTDDTVDSMRRRLPGRGR